jgi:hypothetical protein
MTQVNISDWVAEQLSDHGVERVFVYPVERLMKAQKIRIVIAILN